jgi:hypothetical protein
MADSDADDFFEGVGGAPAQSSPPPAPHALGVIVRAAVLRNRESGDQTLSAAEERKREALLDSLQARGLFRNPPPSKVAALRPAGVATLLATRWRRPVSLAAVLALCAIGVLQLLPDSHQSTEPVERGAGELTVRSDDPARTERELAAELTQDGAQVVAVQINDTTWTLSITLLPTPSGAPQPAVRERVRRSLAQRGIRVSDPDAVRIIVESTARP